MYSASDKLAIYETFFLIEAKIKGKSGSEA